MSVSPYACPIFCLSAKESVLTIVIVGDGDNSVAYFYDFCLCLSALTTEKLSVIIGDGEGSNFFSVCLR